METAIVPTQVERSYPNDTVLVSKTDIDGCITYANAAFIELSGYDEEELIGHTHGIMRHPDVPDAIFKHLWQTLQSGRPWRGVIKNLCKNGDHYWADAYIVPLRKRGQIIGYMSARSAATAEQVANAKEQYAYSAQHGKVKAEAGLNPRRFFSVKRAVLTGILFVLSATVVSAWFGVKSLETTSLLVYELQRHNDAAAQVSRNNQLVTQSLSNILLSLQHAPGNRELGDSHDIQDHLATIRDRAQQMDATLAGIADNKTINLVPIQQMDSLVSGFSNHKSAIDSALNDYLRAGRALLNEGFLPLAEMLEHGQYSTAQQIIIDRIGPLSGELNRHSDLVSKTISDTSIALRRTVDDLYDQTFDRLLFWSLFTTLVVGTCGIIFFLETMGPLNKAMKQMQKIADGSLSEKPDVYGFGEPGKLSSALATMQIHLLVMIDGIQLAASVVNTQVASLRQAVLSILNSTEDQYDQAVQISDALERSGADANQLATFALAASDIAQRISASPTEATPQVLEELFRLTQQTASLANLNNLGAAEIQRLSTKIIELAAVNREGVNDAWSNSQKLDATSTHLHTMLEKFD